jgi:hypothetical protein
MATAYILGYPRKMQSDFKKALSSAGPSPAPRTDPCPLCGSHVRCRGFTGMACAGADTCPNIDPELPPALAKNKAPVLATPRTRPRNARRAARAPLPEQTCERCHERESRCYCSHDATPEDIECCIAMACCAAQDAAEARGEAYVCPHGDDHV